MKYFFVVVLLSLGLRAQNFKLNSFALPDPPKQHHFWTVENRVSIGILAGLVAADGVTTQRGLNEGLREMNPIMRPFVTRGAPGEALGSALGFGGSVAFAYLVHCSHHYKAERLAMRMMMVGESGFVVNNIIAIR